MYNPRAGLDFAKSNCQSTLYAGYAAVCRDKTGSGKIRATNALVAETIAIKKNN